MTRCRSPINCIIPPYIVENMTRSADPKVRDLALDALVDGARLRTMREVMPRPRLFSLSFAERGTKNRKVYDFRNLPAWPLILFSPGFRVRFEGDPATNDPAVDEAYDYSGHTYDFYFKLFNRDSLDDRGMALVSSVHVGKDFNNAFWNGRQMGYGDGDGKVFNRFTKDLNVVGHELTHGVVDSTSDLEYQGESGALNEHFADVFGSLVKQWHLNQDVTQASWLIGDDLITPAPTRTAIRSMKDPGTAFKNDPDIGSDPQPKHMNDKYTGERDNGGVHINSGIPNHAFYLAATKIGGFAWEKMGKIWYDTMLALNARSQFMEAATTTHEKAAPYGASVQSIIKDAWSAVGINIP